MISEADSIFNQSTNTSFTLSYIISSKLVSVETNDHEDFLFKKVLKSRWSRRQAEISPSTPLTPLTSVSRIGLHSAQAIQITDHSQTVEAKAKATNNMAQRQRERAVEGNLRTSSAMSLSRWAMCAFPSSCRS